MYVSKPENYKIIVIGDSGVGKTSILNLYCGKHDYSITVGCDYIQKHLPEYNSILKIWDCAGQERYRALTRLFYRGSHGCVFVFDLSDIKTLYNINKYWIKAVFDNSFNPNIKPILIGNKSDLSINTDYKLIDFLCKKYNMAYLETSITTKKNINSAFLTLTLSIINSSNNHLVDDSNVYSTDYNNDYHSIDMSNNDSISNKIYSFC